MGIDGLGQGVEFMEHAGFTNTGHFVLDSCRESIVELMAECNVPPMDACGQAVELNQVFGDLLVVTHAKGFKVSFGFAYRVMWSKFVFQFGYKFGVVIDPGRVDI